ncbi:MAG: hypothetical protein LUC88_09470 [Prevotella sp.]|nr:hypothetical protein [Prevotella sp.]
MDTITVTCDKGISYNWQAVTVYEVAEDGTETEVEVTIDAEDQYNLTPEDEGYWDEIPLSTQVYIDPAIVEAGKYKVLFPEASFVYGTTSTSSEEITLTYEVDGSMGISNVIMDAVSGDNKFYNLNGQRVSTPRNGVFITNGKKILVK